jgi:hypothetical protein
MVATTVLQDDEAALTRPATKVQVELGMSAYSNAAAHHAGGWFADRRGDQQ